MKNEIIAQAWEKAQRILAMSENRNFTFEERDANIENMLKEYKDSVKIDFIQNRYDRTSSYYALFQMIGQLSVFDLQNDASDVQWGNAVANAWLTKYPGALRTQNLCNIALRGRKNTRHRTVELNIDNEKVKETGIIDINLPDINSDFRKLTSLKGKVVLLDFTAYASQESAERTRLMRSLYEQYHSQGLEIYQVSLDDDIHFWKFSCENLPWVCVHETDGTATKLYGISSIPTFFLINRDNEIVVRSDFMEGSLEDNIQKLL
mgnify:CR=1 FL=1